MSKRLSMKKVREILRLKWSLKRSNREVAASIKVSISTISECVRRAQRAGLSWPLAGDLDDSQLEQLLYSSPRNQVQAEDRLIDWSKVREELSKKGVTLQLLWYEYKATHQQGLGYSRYCGLYRQWLQKIDVCMRQSHVAGEKLFVDYAGMTIPIHNSATGEIHNAQIFVASLGASNYTYVEATMSQTLPDWIDSHARAFTFLGGVPEVVVPDNLKSGIKCPHRYEPDLNPTYYDMANHYGVAIIPTRVATPRDKAKVEEAVQHVERRILAPLRNRIFFSIQELNQALMPLLAELNQRPFQKLPGSRLSQFNELEKAALKPLPVTPYVFAEWKKVTPTNDYHIELEGHYYSVPYQLIKKKLDCRFTLRTVEIFYKGKRMAMHQRDSRAGKQTTLTEHMPKAHQEYAKSTGVFLLQWAEQRGQFIAELVKEIFKAQVSPHYGFKSCQGLVRLQDNYGEMRLQAACQRALIISSYSYKSVESILKNNLDRVPVTSPTSHSSVTELTHDHVRGSDYYQ